MSEVPLCKAGGCSSLVLHLALAYSGRICHCVEVSRGERMILRGTDLESYITEYTLVYEDKILMTDFVQVDYFIS